jgi:hypothetical protein
LLAVAAEQGNTIISKVVAEQVDFVQLLQRQAAVVL